MNANSLKTKLILFALLSSLLWACQTASDQALLPEEEAGTAAPENLPAPDPDNGGLQLPEGFAALVVADNLGVARHLAVRDNGDVYVALRRLQDGHGIVALRDTNGDGRADVIERFGEFPGTGIGIRDGYLYFASDTAVMRYRLREGELLPEQQPEMIVEGFLEQSPHAVKPFAFDDAGHIYVDVGAPSNACQEQMRTPGSPGMDPCPHLERQVGVWRFDADRPGQDQVEDGYRYATGIRHSVAIEWNSDVGEHPHPSPPGDFWS